MNKKTLAVVAITGRRVLVRVEFNAPLAAQGRIADDRRRSRLSS